jgi:CBS domain-containing protein
MLGSLKTDSSRRGIASNSGIRPSSSIGMSVTSLPCRVTMGAADAFVSPVKIEQENGAMQETGSYGTPTVEHARVSDAMNNGIVTCSRDSGLREMGRLMASHHIHSLVVSLDDPARWALVSDVDIAQAAIGRPDATAEDLAVPATGISNEATLIRAIEVMREQRTSHLIVTDTESGHPTGMISALDIAGIVGWGEG